MRDAMRLPISTSTSRLATLENDCANGPAQLPLAITSPFWAGHTKMLTVDAGAADPGIRATLALWNVCRSLGTDQANRTMPPGVTGQNTLLATPRPPASCW